MRKAIVMIDVTPLIHVCDIEGSRLGLKSWNEGKDALKLLL